MARLRSARVVGARLLTVVMAAVVGVTLSDVPTMAQPARPASKSVDPATVPLLPARSAPPVTQPPAQRADFGPLAKQQGTHFDPKNSKAVSQSMFADSSSIPMARTPSGSPRAR